MRGIVQPRCHVRSICSGERSREIVPLTPNRLPYGLSRGPRATLIRVANGSNYSVFELTSRWVSNQGKYAEGLRRGVPTLPRRWGTEAHVIQRPKGDKLQGVWGTESPGITTRNSEEHNLSNLSTLSDLHDRKHCPFWPMNTQTIILKNIQSQLSSRIHKRRRCNCDLSYTSNLCTF